MISTTNVKEIVIEESELRDFLKSRLQLEGKAAEDVDHLGLPFLFTTGSELLRTYILHTSNFIDELPEELRVPQRGYIWHMFCQSVQEIHVSPQAIKIVYQPLEDYRLPFKQFYL